jgi:hypothetical protein
MHIEKFKGCKSPDYNQMPKDLKIGYKSKMEIMHVAKIL